MFDFDICAPHIAIPESFTDDNSVMVVFDLGRLQFRNLSPKLPNVAATEEKNTSDDDGMIIRLFRLVMCSVYNYTCTFPVLDDSTVYLRPNTKFFCH